METLLASFCPVSETQRHLSVLTGVCTEGQHVNPLHLFGVIVLLAALALARGLRLPRALFQQLPRAVVEQHDLGGHGTRLGLVVVVGWAADAKFAEDLPTDRFDAPRLLRVQVDGLARVEPVHQQNPGEPEQQQEQRQAWEPHCLSGEDEDEEEPTEKVELKLRQGKKRARVKRFKATTGGASSSKLLIFNCF